MAVACFNDKVKGEVVAIQTRRGVSLTAFFTDLPAGEHGFHIHRAGDLRGEGCAGACEHFHRGPPSRHGDAPGKNRFAPVSRFAPRHTGDLGNIIANKRYTYFLHKVSIADLLGRSVIVHADPDDLGLGDFPDSATTGHSGARIGCAIFGRAAKPRQTHRQTRRQTRRQKGGVLTNHPHVLLKTITSKRPKTYHRHIQFWKAALAKPLSEKNRKGVTYLVEQLEREQEKLPPLTK